MVAKRRKASQFGGRKFALNRNDRIDLTKAIQVSVNALECNLHGRDCGRILGKIQGYCEMFERE